jgi:hypothetical protein
VWWSSLTTRLRTLITLAVLSVLLLGGVAWGWEQVKKPFPGKVDVPICVNTTYAAGEELFVQDVTVSVLNASGREGLAAKTLQDLEDAGFAAGQTANAPKGTVALTAPSEIWVSDADNPGAKLLRARLGQVPVRTDVVSPAAGITVVVGDGFEALRQGPDSVLLDADAVVCSPPVG